VGYDVVGNVACNLHPSPFMKTDLSQPAAAAQPLRRFPEATTIAKLAGFAVTGMLCIFTAVMTTVVESGGFWQNFWLGICIVLFVCTLSLVIWATKDGLRLDHAGLSFEHRDRSSVAEQKTGLGENHP
jgi:hypothetical protein